MKKLLIYCLLLFNGSLAFAQNLDSIGLLYSTGKIEKAYLQSSKIINEYPENSQLVLFHGRILVDLGRYAEGKTYLTKAIALDNDKTYVSAWAWAYLGHACFMTSDYLNSEDALKRCLKLNATENVNKYANNRMFSFGFDKYFSDWKIIETEHLRFHIQTPAEIKNVENFTAQREMVFVDISQKLGVTLPKKIDFFVWDNAVEPKTKFNITLGFAYPEFVCIYAQKNQTKGHEMAHVLTHYIGKVQSKTGLINEGVAVYFNQNGDNKLSVVKDLMSKNGVSQVSIKELWEHWEKGDMRFAYPLAGAFVTELVDKFGIGGLKALLADQTYENAIKLYGNKIDETILDFEKKLEVKQSSIDTTKEDFLTKIILENNKKGRISLSPIILLNGEKMSIASMQTLNITADQVKSVSLVFGEAANQVFGKEGKFGALLVETKSGSAKKMTPQEPPDM